MSEQLHPGLHPDPDTLSAFVEGVLPEHERLQCLAHLGECSQCREVVFLAQEPQPAPAASTPVPTWRRWFRPVPVFATIAAGFVVVFGVSLYLHYKSEAPVREAVARVREAPPPAQPREIPTKAQAAPRPAADKNSHRVARPTAVLPATRSMISATTPTMAPPTLPPPPPLPTQSDNLHNQQVLLPPALLASNPPPDRSPSVNIKDGPGSGGGFSGITGTVTDPAGAIVFGATVTVRQLAGRISRNARTDVMGQFRLTGLPEGRYELQITVPGFRTTSREVDLQPRQIATADSTLEIGSSAESVTVTAEAATLQTSSAEVSRVPRRKSASLAGPRPLPSVLPAIITATSGQIMLAVDSTGALFLSRNAGKHWKAIKSVWPGKVVRLVTPPELSQSTSAVFQLTTDSDSTWLSRDGSHWYPAPTRH